MTLDNLTPEDWTALASLDPDVRDIEIRDPGTMRRWRDAYIVNRLGGNAARILSFGHGVIAAARVLVPRAEDAEHRAAMACDQEPCVDCPGCALAEETYGELDAPRDGRG